MHARDGADEVGVGHVGEGAEVRLRRGGGQVAAAFDPLVGALCVGVGGRAYEEDGRNQQSEQGEGLGKFGR